MMSAIVSEISISASISSWAKYLYSGRVMYNLNNVIAWKQEWSSSLTISVFSFFFCYIVASVES